MIVRSLLFLFLVGGIVAPAELSTMQHRHLVSHQKESEEFSMVNREIRSRMNDKSSEIHRNVTATIIEECKIYGVDPLFVIAVIEVESKFEIRAISRSGAHGLMQIMPVTFRTISGLPPTLDPTENIKTGVKYIRYLYDRGFGRDNPEHLLLAYNKGPGGARALSELEIRQESYAPKVMRKYRRLLKNNGFNPEQAKKLFIRDKKGVNISQ